MDKRVKKLLQEFDALVSNVNDMDMKVRFGSEDFREATDKDKLDFLRGQWFELTEQLSTMGYDIEQR